jgi:hypothetical protein
MSSLRKLQNICVTNDHVYVAFVVITIRYFPLQTQEYSINGEIYTSYAGAVGILLNTIGKLTMGKIEIISVGMQFRS